MSPWVCKVSASLDCRMGRTAPETATLPEKAPETAMAASDLMPENMM